MATFYTIDAANARIPEVRELLLLLRDQRDELVRLRDRLVDLRVPEPDDTGRGGGDAADASRTEPASSDAAANRGTTTGHDEDAPSGERTTRGRGATDEIPLDDRIGAPFEDGVQGEAERIRLRMQGVVDQMQASVARIDSWGITLRDIDSGLIDFPALVTGREVWLCWRLGEGDVDWWHELDVGFSGRRRLSELE